MRRYSRDEWTQVFDHVLGSRLVGQPAQGIRELSAVQRYEIGSRMEMPAPDYRIFHYCRADIAIPLVAIPITSGVGNNDTLHFMNSAVAGVAGDRFFTVVIDPADGAYVANQFRGGYLTVHTGVIQITYNIIGNDVDDGVNVRLHLGEPLIAAVPLPTFCEIHENEYNSTGPMTGAGDQSVVAVPLIPVTVDNFYWGQTWGPCLCAAAVGGGIGAVVNEKSVYFQDDGSIGCGTDLAPGTGFQYAGYVLPRTFRLAAIADSIHFMLQLAP